LARGRSLRQSLGFASLRESDVLPLILAAAGGYLLGSIPFGLVLTRMAGLGDIRQIGSGNIGATNVLRTGRKGLALATLLLDGGKGAIAVGLAWLAGVAVVMNASLDSAISPDLVRMMPLVAGFAAVLGHNFPVWLGFKGGKGVATTLGTIIAAAWPVGLAACGTWLVVAFVFRISSLSALVALALAPVYAWFLAGPETAAMAAGLAVLGFIRHHANIARLLKGEEPKIGAKKKA
jgi:glycerol-3-phosphate acyltransferase PlsY